MKKNIKIGISLLIAMAFLLPATSVFAGDSGTIDASNVDPIAKTASPIDLEFDHQQISKAQMVDGQIVPLQGGPCPVGVVDIDLPPAIATGCHNITITVCKLDHVCEEFECEFAPAEVKKFAEIYKYHSEEDPDETVEIYCTDFEDPCDIYDNWATFDAPVWGANGAIDTWTWSSKRSNSPDHSFHNTAFDIYLESQLDYLVLNAGGSGLDVSAYDEVEVCFSHFAEGDVIIDGDVTIIQDAGYVEYSFDDATYIQATEEYFDTEGAWEDVCFIIDTTGEDNLFVRWVWYSDPTFCYEGWYIDDVCVTGVLEGSFDEWWELVWDSHSWPQLIEEECEEYTFPLQWCVQQEGTYMVCAWIQVLDECHHSVTEYYDPYCIEIEVGDTFNIIDDAVYTSPGCPVEEGTDVTIYSDICNDGTLDATDVQVKVTVQRGFIDTVLETSFDCTVDEVLLADAVVNPNYGIDNWFQSATPGRSAWHFTEYEEGQCYLANFDESAGNKFLTPGPSTTEWVCTPYIFSGSDRNADCTIFFDAAWSLPDTVNQHWHIGVMDDSSGYLYYITAGYDGQSNGDGSYVAIEESVSSLIQSLYGAGHTTDSDTDLSVIFFFFKDSSDNSITAPLTWSGIKIDNFQMDKLVAIPEPIIFTETVIVPYLNVSDCTTVEFLWEDVGAGQYVITEEVLTEDDNMDDNIQVTTCNVYNIMEEAEFYCVDYTDGIPGDWVLEGCCGGVIWAGDPATTAYGNDWDTSLYIAPEGNRTLTFDNVTRLTFDAWWQLNVSDEAFVEYSTDGGLHWTILVTFGDDSVNPPENWEACGPYIIPKATDQIRFRFISNETEINRGFMIDNIEIYRSAWTFFEADGTSLDDFMSLQTPAGCWWFDSWDSQYFVYDTGQVTSYYTWFPDGYMEPSWGVFDNEYFNLGLTGNLFPDDIDTAIVWEFSAPDAFYGWIEKTVYYCIPDNPNVTANFEISVDGGANWEELEKYIGSAHFDYAPGNPLWWVVSADYQYWDSNNVPITDYLTVDDIMVRFHMVSIEDLDFFEYAGFGPMTDGIPIAFYGMSDLVAPFTTILMEGTFDETYGYYTSEVAVWLEATDDITGVAATYYELDGTQYTYSGPFIINGDGMHTLCYWSVDNEGNTEVKKCIAPFKIDESGPSVTISIADGPGIYLLGNKLMSSEKYIFLFGGVDVKASVTIDGAPLQTVEFYMNDELFGEDTSAPFALRCTLKNQGSATFKVIAKDVLGATASDSITVDTYIKLL